MKNPCELCKMMKGEDNPAWKTHNTEDCRSKIFYKKRMTGFGEKSEPDYKRYKRGDYEQSCAIKMSTLRNAVK